MRAKYVFKSIKSVAVLAGLLSIMGCSSMSVEQISRSTPEFDFVSYFEGHRRASGWFSARFGKSRRHFCGDFFGTVQNDGTLELDEKLVYSDGVIETRVWDVSITKDGKFSAESESLVGKAFGKVLGNVLNMKYVMNVLVAPEKTWTLSMDDYMILQADGSLHNITHVKKYGVRIGTVSTQYFRPTAEQAEDDLCGSDATGSGPLALTD